ncbi:MAG TPA: leukotriene A4 hydrolase C-terminal domain-containing protein, partial [Gemmatimonadaceae bacterium]|nr:leukotriene A4 hydrolase C-terminal domain-containing protein [Gemmatimonadaceae bacterium]
AFMRQRLLRGDESERIGIEQWVFQPGIPANIPAANSAAFAAVEQQIGAWRNGGPTSALQTSAWSTHEWLRFLRGLPVTISAPRLAELDAAFRLTASGNSEILEEWLQIAIRNRYEPAFPALDRFLTTQGRRKFLTPLYTGLSKTDWGRAMAIDIYRRARPTYHSVAVNTIDQVLKWSEVK